MAVGMGENGTGSETRMIPRPEAETNLAELCANVVTRLDSGKEFLRSTGREGTAEELRELWGRVRSAVASELEEVKGVKR